MIPDRPSTLTIAVAAMLVLAGCSGQQLTDQQEQRVVEEFNEQMSEIDGYHATMNTTVTVDNETYSTTTEVWVRPDTGELRQEVLAPDERAGHLTVSNGSVMWTYDPDDGTATRFEVPEASTDTSLASNLDELANRSDIVYNGTETLDGEETHKITLVPNESADVAVDATTTMWLDSDRMFPLKIHTQVDSNTATTVRFTDVELNPGLSDDRFEFDPPEGVEVREPEMPDFQSYDSRAALGDAVDRDLPDPTLPGGYTFDTGTVTESDRRHSVTLVYANGTDQVSIGIAEAPDGVRTDGETVEIDNRTATYDSIGDVGMVVWTCDDTRYSVTGTLDRQSLLDVAASIDC